MEIKSPERASLLFYFPLLTRGGTHLYLGIMIPTVFLFFCWQAYVSISYTCFLGCLCECMYVESRGPPQVSSSGVPPTSSETWFLTGPSFAKRLGWLGLHVCHRTWKIIPLHVSTAYASDIRSNTPCNLFSLPTRCMFWVIWIDVDWLMSPDFVVLVNCSSSYSSCLARVANSLITWISLWAGTLEFIFMEPQSYFNSFLN